MSGKNFKKYVGPESQFQMSVAKFLSLKYPDLTAIHVPNESPLLSDIRRLLRGRLSSAVASSLTNEIGKRTGGMLKASGVKAGVPDVLIFDLKLAIELKVGNNKLSESQAEFIGRLMRLGWECHVSYSLDEVMYIIDSAYQKATMK